MNLWTVTYNHNGQTRTMNYYSEANDSDKFYAELHPSLRAQYVDCEMVTVNV